MNWGLLSSENEIFNYDVFTWKIPNISSVPHVVDYCIQSPPFSYDGESLILKMYPYGQTAIRSEGYIDLIIERLPSPVNRQTRHVELFCTDALTRKNFLYDHKVFTFDCPKLLNCMKNIRDSPEKWRIAPNDTFTLMCALGKGTRDELNQIYQTETLKQNVGESFKKPRMRADAEVGEILKEYLEFKTFIWKLCAVTLCPAGFFHHREEFLFANASWLVKIYPFFWMEGENKRSFGVVLERMQSKIPEHYVIFKIYIHSDLIHTKSKERLLFFNRSNTQSPVINFQLKEGDIPERICLHNQIDMKMKKDAVIESEFHPKSVEPVQGSNCTLRNSLIDPDNKIFEDFKELFLKQDECDVMMNVQGKEFKAHKAMLIARSPVFAAAYKHDMKEKAGEPFEIEDCDPSSFSDFLCFLYCGMIENLSAENAFSLFKTADKYDVQDLKTKCLEFIRNNLSVDTFCETITLALQHSQKELLQLATEFFPKHFQEIIVTVKWQSFLVENPIQANEIMVKSFVTNKK